MTNVIAFRKVKEPYGWLGNMAPFTIVYENLTWRTSKALFQALRFDPADMGIRNRIYEATSPMAAKLIAKANRELMLVEPRSPADVENMRLVLRLKLRQHPKLYAQLIATNNATLVEDVTARPTESGLFWGAARDRCLWRGQNTLGLLWMELREAHRKAFGFQPAQSSTSAGSESSSPASAAGSTDEKA